MTHTFLVGNGLGMALDPNYFTLQASVNNVWNGLNDSEKELLRKFFKISDDNIPTINEDLQELADINTLSFLTGFIKRLTREHENFSLLSEHGLSFQHVVNSFVWKIAYFYHDFGQKKIADNENLNRFCQNFKRLFEQRDDETIHVATLNYDDLLYGAFDDLGIFGSPPKRFSTCHLVDGFTRGGQNNDLFFNPLNLVPKFGNSYGSYLHLHGSPLFINKPGDKRILKLERRDVDNFIESGVLFSPHVVLDNFEKKELDIKMSPLLSTYFGHFTKAIEKSDKITLIGYNGCDPHINDILAEKVKDESNTPVITIVEYNGLHNHETRQKFWNDQIKADALKLVLMSNILEYDFRSLKE